MLALVFGLGSAAAEAYHATEAQRQACTPDVFRLCPSDVPNVPAIVACMKRQRSHLSPDCRAAMAGKTRTVGREATHHTRTAVRESGHHARTAELESGHHQHHHARAEHRRHHDVAERHSSRRAAKNEHRRQHRELRASR